LKKAIAVPVIATASEAWREAIQTFFLFFASSFLPPLRTAAEILSGLPRRYAPRNDSPGVFQQSVGAFSSIVDTGSREEP